MELLGADFCGPFHDLPEGFRFLLIVVDYFSRFIWTYPCAAADSPNVTRCLDSLFYTDGVPVGFYVDPGSHFGDIVRNYVGRKGVLWLNSPSASKKSTGMAEKAVDIVQRAMAKTGPSYASKLQKVTLEINLREISFLGYSPFHIHRGYQPRSSIDLAFPAHHVQVLNQDLNYQGFPDELWGADSNENEEWSDAVLEHVGAQDALLEKVSAASDLQRQKRKEYHDLRFQGRMRNFPLGSMAMLYDHTTAGQKLRPSWRGPFIVSGTGGEHGRSYRLSQINGTPIPRHFHIDQLKPFYLRNSYLVTGLEERLPAYQNLRAGTASHSLPPELRKKREMQILQQPTVPGVWGSE